MQTRVEQKLEMQKQKETELTAKKEFEQMLKQIAQNSRESTERMGIRDQQTTTASIAKILAANNNDKVGLELLSKLVTSMAGQDITLNAQNMAAKVASEMGKDIDILYKPNPQSSDLALPKEAASSKAETKPVTQSQMRNDAGDTGKDTSTSRDKVSIAKEYTAVYASCVVNASPEIKRRLERSEDELRQRGFSESDISSIKSGVKKSIRTDLSKAVKDAFLKKLLIKGKNLDAIMAAKNVNDALGQAAGTSVESAAFDGLKGLAKEQAEEARAEAKDFILEDLEIKLMEKILSGQTKELDSEIKNLVVLAMKLGIDMVSFMVKWKKKKVDLGLFFLDPRLALELGLSGSGQERESRYDMDEDEEKEILVNRMRALFMRRAIKGDMITKLDTAFKMRKLKNGLIKLGLKIDDFERIEKEGVLVAKDKLTEMITEALTERSTLYELAGPAFKLIEKKIKGVMSNLDRIGHALTVSEFEGIRDMVNRKMYDIAIQELYAVDSELRVKKDPCLEKKRGQLIKLVARLKKESKIDGIDIDPRRQELVRHGVEGLSVIQESA
jgi:hypothetical protein